ncbi:uncharacterized protein LOC129595930 [Paramacrobiotus metropolitanus]|uniref:uncharacterized protein LOC129595930 n=1 Tax=Paramacrobiotus metropolitanus TaxID=2943436 RepID=UPI0024461641|nr:uncharacterized protein LOC129595930 [Paramacrobiotus metropolitanus]
MQAEVETTAAASTAFRCVVLANAATESLQQLVQDFQLAHPGLARAALRDAPYDAPITQQFAVLQVVAVQGCTIQGSSKQRQWKMDAVELQPAGGRWRGPYSLLLEEFQADLHAQMPPELQMRRTAFEAPQLAPVIVLTGFVKEKSAWFPTEDKPTLRCAAANNPQVFVATFPRPPSQPAASVLPTAAPADDPRGRPDPLYALPGTPYRPLSQLPVGGPYALAAVLRYAYAPKLANSRRGRPEWMQSLGLVDPSLDVAGDAKFKLTLFSTQPQYLLPEGAAAGDCLVIRDLFVKRPYHLEKPTGVGYADRVRFAYVSAASADMAPTIARNPSTYLLQEADGKIISDLRVWYQSVADVIAALEKRPSKQETGAGNGDSETGQTATVPSQRIAAGVGEDKSSSGITGEGDGQRPSEAVAAGVAPVEERAKPETVVQPQAAEAGKAPKSLQSGKTGRGKKRVRWQDEEAEGARPVESASTDTETAPAAAPDAVGRAAMGEAEGVCSTATAASSASNNDNDGGPAEAPGTSVCMDMWSERGVFVERNRDGSERFRGSVLELVEQPPPEPEQAAFNDFVIGLRSRPRNAPIDFRNGDLQACVTQ